MTFYVNYKYSLYEIPYVVYGYHINFHINCLYSKIPDVLVVVALFAFYGHAKVNICRDCHGYAKTRGFEVTGLGTVVGFGTPRHTAYPYRGIVGTSRVYYSK
jgi:hypothetical protein